MTQAILSALSFKDGDRSSRAIIVIYLLLAGLLVTCLFSLAVGPMHVSLADTFRILAGFTDEGSELQMSTLVITDIRAPRTVMGLLVGASLAISGAILQSLFRNPLADPGLVGVSSGAALAAVTVIVLGVPSLLQQAGYTSFNFLPFAAFSGGLITTVTLYMISTRSGQTSTATMLLSGIAIAALVGAATGALVFISTDQQLRDLTFWSLGSLAGATWPKILAILPFTIPVFVLASLIANGLNGLLLGETQALHIGVHVQRTKKLAIFLVAMAVGAAVSVSGIIGFVGIIVPHILRLVIGPDNRYLLLGCMLLGAILLLCADMIARILVSPAELPIGIVTAIIGGPFFLWLLLGRRGLIDV